MKVVALSVADSSARKRVRSYADYQLFTLLSHDWPVKEISSNYQDRELTWLDFDTRVLELTEDPTIPLLERLRFLAIFSSNLVRAKVTQPGAPSKIFYGCN